MKTNVVKFCLPLVYLLFALVGCQDENYYDESNNKASKAELFPENVLISDNFNWLTTKNLELSVSVDDKYNAAYNYTVEVYDANPLSNTEASLVGGGVANASKDFVSNVVIPSALEILYVQQTDPTGEKRITAVLIENKSSLSASFKPLADSSASIKSAAMSTLRSIAIDVPTTPSNAIDITSEGFRGSLSTDGGSYVIPVGKEYRGVITTSNWGSGGTLFVEGTWTIPSSVNMNYYTVVVQKGGAIKFENESSSFDLFAQLIIAEGASFGKANINLDFNSAGPAVKQIANSGVLNAKVINLGRDCVLENYGEVKIEGVNSKNNAKAFIRNSGVMTVANVNFTGGGSSITNSGTMTITAASIPSNSLLSNSGTMTVTTIDFVGSGATLINNCILVVTKKMKLAGTTVEISEGALISALAIESANSRINLFGNAMLVAETTEIINGGTTNIYGLGSGFALFKVTTLTFSNWGVFAAHNNLAINADHVVDKGGQNTAYAPAYFTNSSAAAPNIQATECNGNGNPVKAGTPIVRSLPLVQLGTYSYAFEDNWPTYGDYDMNDFVADVALIRNQNSDNKLTKLTIKSRLLAVGATKRLAGAIQLDGILANDIKSVTYSNSSIIGGNTFKLTSSGIESEQTYAVIPLCDDAHQAFGVDSKSIVNTTGPTLSPVEQTITIEFNTPVKLLTNDDLNVFIVTGGSKNVRTEVHLNGKASTDKVNVSQFISANLKSSQQTYRSHENLVWGLCVPGSFDYPKEWVKITEVYPLFRSWAESNGVDNTDWYKKGN